MKTFTKALTLALLTTNILYSMKQNNIIINKLIRHDSKVVIKIFKKIHAIFKEKKCSLCKKEEASVDSFCKLCYLLVNQYYQHLKSKLPEPKKECPVCLENKTFITLQCAHHICKSCHLELVKPRRIEYSDGTSSFLDNKRCPLCRHPFE